MSCNVLVDKNYAPTWERSGSTQSNLLRFAHPPEAQRNFIKSFVSEKVSKVFVCFMMFHSRKLTLWISLKMRLGRL